jgi:hypothetical protein
MFLRSLPTSNVRYAPGAEVHEDLKDFFCEYPPTQR